MPALIWLWLKAMSGLSQILFLFSNNGEMQIRLFATDCYPGVIFGHKTISYFCQNPKIEAFRCFWSSKNFLNFVSSLFSKFQTLFNFEEKYRAEARSLAGPGTPEGGELPEHCRLSGFWIRPTFCSELFWLNVGSLAIEDQHFKRSSAKKIKQGLE